MRVMAALDKLLYFDTTLVFDTYIRSLLAEVELAKNKVQNYAKELEPRSPNEPINCASCPSAMR